MTIKIAVFPVAGLGSRFLPATKATPKEMLPIVDKPLIQYAVEEAIDAGMTELVFVTNHTKPSIESHFERNADLEQLLVQREQQSLVDKVKSILPDHVRCHYVLQHEALGLGHAVLCARALVGHQAFTVLLADDFILTPGRSCLMQMVDAFKAKQASLLALQSIGSDETQRYGVIDCEASERAKNPMRLSAIVEKPPAEQAPSLLGVVGRYILTPRIFDHLEKTKRGVGGEIQLTDAIAALMQEEAVYGYQYEGERFDCGHQLGFLKACMQEALRRPELSSQLRSYLDRLP
jgi:UTP--glucose-1-phosphate uridylyltransferase